MALPYLFIKFQSSTIISPRQKYWQKQVNCTVQFAKERREFIHRKHDIFSELMERYDQQTFYRTEKNLQTNIFEISFTIWEAW